MLLQIKYGILGKKSIIPSLDSSVIGPDNDSNHDCCLLEMDTARRPQLTAI